MTKHLDVVRLLPWVGSGGKPCYLAGGGSGGYVSRLADNMEAIQLGLASDLIKEAQIMFASRNWTPGELQLLAVQLTETLTDVHRVAVSRGARLSVSSWDDSDLTDDDDGDDDSSAGPSEAVG